MSNKSTRKRFGVTSMAFGTAAGCGLAVALFAGAAAMESLDHSEMRIGTYEPERAFQSYHGMQEFSMRMQELQQEAQQAQQQGDQQRMMQIQQEMERLQNEVVDQFHNDVERVTPKVAEEAELHIIATEIVYSADELEDPKDVTDKVIRKLNEDAEPEQREAPSDAPW